MVTEWERSECPSAWAIVSTGTPASYAIVAHVCLDQYVERNGNGPSPTTFPLLPVTCPRAFSLLLSCVLQLRKSPWWSSRQ